MIKNILYCLNHRQNVFLQSLSGMGLANFTKKVTNEIRQNSRTVVIDIYPHDSSLDKYQFIEALVLSKFALERPHQDVDSMSHLQKYLSTKSVKLVIVLHKIQQYVNLTIYLDYIKSFYECFDVTVLITATTSQVTQSLKHDLTIGSKVLVFPGFIRDFNQIVDEIDEVFSCHTTQSHRRIIYQLCLGHTALIKSLVQLCTTSSFKYDPEKVIKNEVVASRLQNLFQSIQFVAPNLDILFHQRSKLIELGISDGHQIGWLFNQHYLRQKTQKSVLESLTPIEKSIFQYIQSRGVEYSTVEQILGVVYPTVYTDKSDWSIYKHINNLKNKISDAGYQIKSRRSLGYRLLTPNGTADIN